MIFSLPKIKTVLQHTLIAVLLGGCSSSTGIFPTISTSTSESTVVFPNPISVTLDTVNNQVMLVNSNVDIFFDTGSVALFSFDATTPSAPQLSLTQVLSVPNFAGQSYYDGAGSLYVPFRASSTANKSLDQFIKYTVAAGSITESIVGQTQPNPFGIDGDGTTMVVVSDDVLAIHDSSLNQTSSVNLTSFEQSGLADSDSGNVLDVVVDTANSRAYVTNLGGRLFVVNLNTLQTTLAVDGPLASRGIALSGTNLFVVDALTESLLVMDTSVLSDPASAPASLDDSAALIASISVGSQPVDVVVDAVNQRAFVSNMAESSISVIDLVTMSELARISLKLADLPAGFLRAGLSPLGLAQGTFNGTPYLFVSCFDSNALFVIRADTFKVVEMFPNRVAD